MTTTTLFQEYITFRDSNLLKLHISQGTFLGWFLPSVDLNKLSLVIIYIIVNFTLRLYQQKNLKIALSGFI